MQGVGKVGQHDAECMKDQPRGPDQAAGLGRNSPFYGLDILE